MYGVSYSVDVALVEVGDGVVFEKRGVAGGVNESVPPGERAGTVAGRVAGRGTLGWKLLHGCRITVYRYL